MGLKDNNMTSIIIICTLYLLLAVTGMTLIKIGHGSENLFSISAINISISACSLLGVLFYGLSFLIFVFYISKLNIGIIIPVISGLNCVAIAIIGYKFFKESITTGQFVGISLIIIGTVLVGVFK